MGQVARAGYMEVLTFVLTSHEENFDMLNRTDDGNKAVIIANPRTSEFEVNCSSTKGCLYDWIFHLFVTACYSRKKYVIMLLMHVKRSFIEAWPSRLGIFISFIFLNSCR